MNQFWSLLWQDLNDWATRKAPPHALALFRIALGCWLLFYWGLQVVTVPLRYSSVGLLSPLYDLSILTPPSPLIAFVLYTLLLFAFAGVALGYHLRLSALVALALYVYYWHLSLHLFGTSFDRIFMLSLLVLAFSGADKACSLRMKKTYGSWTDWEYTSVLPQRLLALQITFTYLGVGLQKLWLPHWETGAILYYAFIGRWGTPLGYFLGQTLPLWVFDWMVYMTKAFEVMLPFGLWIKPARKWFFLGGALFHTAITLTLSIWWFMFLLPSYVLFLEPEEAQALWESKLKRWIGHS